MTKDQPTADACEVAPGEGPLDVDLPHEGLDLYQVLEEAYRLVAAWQGVSWSRGTTGDQLKRALSGALLRYTEGYYADGGNQASLWKSARASSGEAATGVQILALDGTAPREEAVRVRELLGRAMRMLPACFADGSPAARQVCGRAHAWLTATAAAWRRWAADTAEVCPTPGADADPTQTRTLTPTPTLTLTLTLTPTPTPTLTPTLTPTPTPTPTLTLTLTPDADPDADAGRRPGR